MARIVIERECEHGQMGKHLLAERRFDPCLGRCGASHTPGDPHFDCPGGTRRVLEPDEYAPIEVIEGGNEYRCEFCGSRDYYGDRRANRIQDGKYVLIPLDVLTREDG